jgi:hypothetical protein
MEAVLIPTPTLGPQLRFILSFQASFEYVLNAWSIM